VSTKRAPIAALTAAAALLGGAGCGATTSVKPNGTLQIALNEYRVTPQSVRARTGPITVVVHNYGRLTHNLVISLDGLTQAATKPIPPGQTADLYVTLTPGKYELASTILSDRALGAYGTLTVVR
jgi:Cupredoxin-like domain